LHIILTLVIFVNTAHARYPEEHTETKNIQISVGEWPPFLSASLPDQGIVAHLLRDVFHEAGYSVEFVFLPWVRAYQVTAQGDYSATAVWMFKSEREEEYLYSAPVLNERFVFFHLKDNKFDWNTIEDLRNKSIGGGLGYSYGPEFDKAAEEGVFSLSRQETVKQNLRMLAAGRIDLYIEEMSVANYTLSHETPDLLDNIAFHEKAILENQSFLLFPKGSAKSLRLMKNFNAQLEAFRKSGRYETYFTSEK
jgi:polar amino acid transport system substrate-binding protein